ncbi:MAG: TlpA disulfide reductase family protein [Gemmataceae bacterium]
MRQMFIAVALVAVAGLVGFAEDKKDDQKQETQSFTEIRNAFLKKFRGASNEEDRDAALKEYGPKFVAYAQKNPTEKDAFGAVMFAIQIGSIGKNDQITKQAVGLLKKDHLANPEIKNALPMLGRFLGSETGPFMKELMDKGGTEEIRATACSSLIEALEDKLAEAAGEEAEKIKKEMAELRKIGVEKYKMKDLFVGATMMELKSEDLDGKAVKLSDYKGKVVVLDIWATWCPPCRAMIPHERELVERLKEKPFALISVSFDDKKETLTNFLEKEPMPWVHWWNGRKGEIGEQLNIRFFPTIFVLDAKGVIRYKGVRGKAMDKAVDTLLAEMEAEKPK